MASETIEPILPTLRVRVRFPTDWSLRDLQQHLGGISFERIRLFPPPGCATDDDVTHIAAQEDCLCELEDGILVEKPMGWYESLIAILIATEVRSFVTLHNLGQVLGPDGFLAIRPGVVKIPDVPSFRRRTGNLPGLGPRPLPKGEEPEDCVRPMTESPGTGPPKPDVILGILRRVALFQAGCPPLSPEGEGLVGCTAV